MTSALLSDAYSPCSLFFSMQSCDTICAGYDYFGVEYGTEVRNLRNIVEIAHVCCVSTFQAYRMKIGQRHDVLLASFTDGRGPPNDPQRSLHVVAVCTYPRVGWVEIYAVHIVLMHKTWNVSLATGKLSSDDAIASCRMRIFILISASADRNHRTTPSPRTKLRATTPALVTQPKFVVTHGLSVYTAGYPWLDAMAIKNPVHSQLVGRLVLS